MHDRFASHSRPHSSSARSLFRYERLIREFKLAEARDERYDAPLRAKSVCLAERPRSKYTRTVCSADHSRSRYSQQKLFHRRPLSKTNVTRYVKPDIVVVKHQNRNAPVKVPCTLSVQTLSIPMKYADNTIRHSTFKPQNSKSIDINKTKYSNPPKQVSDNKRLCETVRCGKETENKLLVQISEAEQVSDFERILNCNAIQCERANGHVWRRCLASQPSAAVLPRPRSSYSLYTVSQTYHYLFQQHEESLQPLIERYRQDNIEQKSNIPQSLLGNQWYDNLQDLSEFYEDDPALRREIENITDRIISEEVKATEEPRHSAKSKNFNVNLTGLIELHVSGEGCSSISGLEDFGLSPDVEKQVADEGNAEKEWISPIMNANYDDQSGHDKDQKVESLAQNLNSVQIDSDAKVPTITFSNCCDGFNKSDSPNNSDVVIHLTVPSIDSIDEARPPMM
ncbi:unnamed protein product [Diatraea saccharalis]|uniref:Uncharacterized protein n=1 Tax=Diatraea saccharalis TaxID=40085 RepID=A0A9N9R7R0_9NEOP|nr:unnamed protein product [Diatraea saccharalis]